MIARAVLSPEGISDLAARVLGGEHVSPADIRRLWEHRSLHAVRALADEIRELSADNEVSYEFVKDPQAAIVGVAVVDPRTDLPARLPVLARGRPPRLIVRDPNHEWTGIELLRACAVCRISAPRETQIQVLWSEVGPEVAQVLLGYGISALLGPMPLHLGGSERDVSRAELRALIYRAGRIPVEASASASPEVRP